MAAVRIAHLRWAFPIFLLVLPAHLPSDSFSGRIRREYELNGESSDLYLFPELNIIGGFYPDGIQKNPDNYRNIGEPVPDGPSCQKVARMAQKYCTHICCGLVEREGARLYISHLLYGPNGVIIHQRKLFPQSPKHPLVFTSGESLNTGSLLGHCCTILACADWLEAETNILAGLKEVSLILAPTGPFQDEPFLRKLLYAKALYTDSFILAAFGHSHTEGPQILSGIAADPGGEEIFSGSRQINKDAIFHFEIAAHPPGKRWGGFKARAPILANNLRSYLPTC